jgi:large conductance mechanosensitive channel
MGGFKKFLLRGNVVDLAVGVIIGAAFGTVVTALVKGIITPLIGLLLGTPDLSALNVEAGGQKFLVGDFVNAVISFVLVALVVYYLVVVPMNRLLDRFKPAPTGPAPTKECPECLSRIPKQARRCAQCGAQLEAPSEAVLAAMRRVAAPGGEEVAEAAAEILANRLRGRESPPNAGPGTPPEQRERPPGHAA